MRGVLLTVAVIFLTFGVKVGVVDLSVLVPCLVLPLIALKKWTIPSGYVEFVGVISLLCCYQIVVQAMSGASGFEVPARLARAAVSAFVVGVIIGQREREDGPFIVGILTVALFVHALVIIAAANIESLNEVLGRWSGNDRVREFRASGLVAGFDMAGLFCIVGCLVAMMSPFASRLGAGAACAVTAVHTVACYFSSRVSMAICGAIFLIQLARTLANKKSSRVGRATLAAIMVLPVVIGSRAIIQIFEVTMSLGVVDSDPEQIAQIAARFATQNPDSFLWEDMLFLPKSMVAVIFGNGVDPLQSDVGYVKEIFRYGLVGLGAALVAHARLIYVGLACATHDQRKRARGLVLALAFLMVFLSAKNNYIFVRGFFALFVLIIAAVAYSPAIDLDDKMAETSSRGFGRRSAIPQ